MPNPNAISEVRCPCGTRVDRFDRFCRSCGRRLLGELGAASSEAPILAEPILTKPRVDWSENRAVVLVMLFAALGPLALPMLWKSRQFSVASKVILTLVVVALTVLVVWLLYVTVARFLEALSTLGDTKAWNPSAK